MKIFGFLGILAVSFNASGCSVHVNSHGDGPSVSGSGIVKEEVRQVSGFTGVTLAGSGKVEIDFNGKEGVTVSAEDNILPLLTTNVEKGILVLGTKDNTSISTNKDIVYKISAKTISSLSLDGSGSIMAKNLKLDALKTEISGSGNIELAGTANSLNINVSGSGSFDSTKVAAKDAVVDVAGSGSVNVDASGTLKVDITGSGSVQYKGDPKIMQSVVGSGSVRKL